jgi:hypothetical protein
MHQEDRNPLTKQGRIDRAALWTTASALAVVLVATFAHWTTYGTKRERRNVDRTTKAADQNPPLKTTPRRDWVTFWTAASALGALLAAAFAGWAAYETQSTVREANRATKATVWLQVLADYETADMLDALNYLRKWQSQNPKFDEPFYQLLTAKDLTPEDAELMKHVDADRRRVMKFFDKLRILTEGDIIDKVFVSQNWDSGTYTYMNDVLSPLHRANLRAMLDTKAITQEDFVTSNRVLSEIMGFYQTTLVPREH